VSEKSVPTADDLTPILAVSRDKEGGLVCMLDVDAFETPGIWGIAVADIVKHVVNAHVRKGFAFQAVNQEVIGFLVAELESPSDKAIDITNGFDWGEE
jgi:hypothetical protein